MKSAIRGFGFAVLIFGAPLVRGQRLYSDTIQGSAQACKSKSYSVIGNRTRGYTLSRSTMDTCKAGTAKSTAAVQLGPPGGSMSTTTGITTAEDIASASMDAKDLVRLIPPAGFTGDTVPVVYSETYQFNIAGVSGPASGQYTICWNIQAEQCMTASVNGQASQTYHVAFPVNKALDAGSGFEFPVQVSGMVEASNGASASIMTTNVAIRIPAGWKYRWASKHADEIGIWDEQE